MSLTNGILFLIAILGTLIHCLWDINKINHKVTNTSIAIKQYFKIEWASILLSIFLGIVYIFVRSEIELMQEWGKYNGVIIFILTFMSNKVLTGLQKKAEKFINEESKK